MNTHFKIEKLPEGLYLATSDQIQGLIAQGRTVSETLEIARDVVRKLIEAKRERKELCPPPLPPKNKSLFQKYFILQLDIPQKINTF